MANSYGEKEQSVLIANKVLEILRLNMQMDSDLAVVKNAVQRWSAFLDARDGGSLSVQVALLSQKVLEVERSEHKKVQGSTALKVALIHVMPALLGLVGGLCGFFLSKGLPG